MERKIYEERYRVNKELEKEHHIIEKMQFGEVDFKELYERTNISQNFIQELKKIGKEINKNSIDREDINE